MICYWLKGNKVEEKRNGRRERQQVKEKKEGKREHNKCSRKKEKGKQSSCNQGLKFGFRHHEWGKKLLKHLSFG